jgi:hypothetical protein
LAVHGQADIRGIAVFLAVVFPPANRAQPHRTRSFESLVSTAWAAIGGRDSIHVQMDEIRRGSDYTKTALCSRLLSYCSVLKRGTGDHNPDSA